MGKSVARQDSQMQMSPPKPTLQEVRSEVAELRTYLEKEFGISPALTFVKQKLSEAITGIEQELRNITIDAQMEARRLEGKQ